MRDEQGGHEEGVRPEFDDPHVAFAVFPRDHQVVAEESVAVPGVQTKVAQELLGAPVSSVGLVGAGARDEEDRLFGAPERAGQPGDDERRCVRRAFLVVGAGQPGDVACMLYQSMLKAASGAEEGPVPLSREADGGQSPLLALVGSTGCEDAVILLQHCEARIRVERGGGDPFNLDGERQGSGGVQQSRARRLR